MAGGRSPDAPNSNLTAGKRASQGDRHRNGPALYTVAETSRPQPMTLGIGSEVEVQIGNRLRAMYDAVLSEPLPDQFLDLIRQLDDAVTARQNAAASQRKAATEK